ncbi:MAG: hypothetical protein KGL02_08290 [Acidobacteriota bacterium]|nr:hypothetical protein [Acidobacteriota bacterium]
MCLRTLVKLVGSLAICLAIAATASAQYGGGGGMPGTGTGGTGSGTGGTPNYNYGNAKAIGIGVGVAAGAAAGIALWVHHRHKAKPEALLIGCTEPAPQGVSLKSEGDGETYMLFMSGGKQLEPGERVELKGAVKNDPAGANAFRVRKVVSDFGACSSAVASKTNEPEASEFAVTTR